MERLAVAVDDAVRYALLVDAIVRLATLGKLVERASRPSLGGVEHDEPRRLADGTLGVARAAVAVGKGKRPCGQGRHTRRPYRQRLQDT